MPDSRANKTAGRSLPSWMSSRENSKKSDGDEPSSVGVDKEDSKGGPRSQAKRPDKTHTNQTHPHENERKDKSETSNTGANKFSKLLDGVVFVLSGFVNPERGELRSKALQMGAEYQGDWNLNCTLLVCAFPNTPKFRQVEADSGTIVTKEWILECHKQKKLVEIETYLMHAGKPWRRQNISTDVSEAKPLVEDIEQSASKKLEKHTDKTSLLKPATSASSKMPQSHAKEGFSPSKVKKWVVDDLQRTISWLESQEEKPEPSEIKKIAAEGILTCLQDAIDSLKQEQDIGQIMEQWNFVPRVVEELRKLDASNSHPKKEIYRQAMVCKRIYEVELVNLDGDSMEKKKRAKIGESASADSRRKRVSTGNDTDYDSDATIEMTEDEIGEAYNNVVSSIVINK